MPEGRENHARTRHRVNGDELAGNMPMRSRVFRIGDCRDSLIRFHKTKNNIPLFVGDQRFSDGFWLFCTDTAVA